MQKWLPMNIKQKTRTQSKYIPEYIKIFHTFHVKDSLLSRYERRTQLKTMDFQLIR